MIKTLKKVNHIEEANIILPASKSISNRLLVLQKLYNLPVQFQILSDSDDTKVLYHCLYAQDNNWNVENCGTAMRFLISYAAVTPGVHALAGNERMRQRPVKDLVDAWKKLDVEISYRENEGFPPLEITSKDIINYPNDISIDGSISSQFISSIMMAGCKLPSGLNIKLRGSVSSKPYIVMTLKLMQEMSLDISWNEGDNIIVCKPYTAPTTHTKTYYIESDWSAASYCYLWVLASIHLGADLRININHIQLNSIQGDSVVSIFFEKFGVCTRQLSSDSIQILKDKEIHLDDFEFDCSQCLDLAPTMALAAFITQVKLKLTGLSNLKHKESDRLKVLYIELNKFSKHSATIISDDMLYIHRSTEINFDEILETYGDHRIAMAFSVLASYGDLKISHPEVVSKSFPSFWEEVGKVGVFLKNGEQ